jgi:hypothetical protein
MVGVLGALALFAVAVRVWFWPPARDDSGAPDQLAAVAPTIHYRGEIDVHVARDRDMSLRRLNEAGALPLREGDTFRITARVDPPAYLYVVWVDPGQDVTPVYPWNPSRGWGSRPKEEHPVGSIQLPTSPVNRYVIPRSVRGVAAIVLLASTTPLDVPDDVVASWFSERADLPIPRGAEDVAVWFDNFTEVREPGRQRTFKLAGDDPFEWWQERLKKAVGNKVAFQSAIMFARDGTR